MSDNPLQEVHCSAAAWKISEDHKQTGYAERVSLGSPFRSLVQDDNLVLEPTGKSPLPLKRVVFHDCVRRDVITTLWAGLQWSSESWVRDAS
jgi:hypothetical protein